MRQLVDHFQQTSYTPRNFNALLPTPRFAPQSSSSRPVGYANQHCISATGSYSYGYSLTGTLTLCSPRGENHFNNARSIDHTFDPKCFEEDSPSALVGEKYKTNEHYSGSMREDDIDACDASPGQFDAPEEAAVNVALKCATREASFEEVLSWLIGASSHQSGFEYAPPPYGETYTQTSTHVSSYSFHPAGSGTCQDRVALLSSAYTMS